METQTALQIEHEPDGDDCISFDINDEQVLGFYPDGRIVLRGETIGQDIEAVSMIVEFIQTATGLTPVEDTLPADQ